MWEILFRLKRAKVVNPTLLCAGLMSFTTPIVECQSKGYVRKVPQGYKSIQLAIQAAGVGDTVLIDEGLYYENVQIRKNITLASRFVIDGDTSHISKTIIDGSRPKDINRGSVIIIEGATDTSCVVSGLTIRRGTGTRVNNKYWKPSQMLCGGGVVVLSKGAWIRNNAIIDNHVSMRDSVEFVRGGGVFQMLEMASATGLLLIIEENVIRGNTVTGMVGGGGGLDLSSNARVRRNEIVGNYVNAGIRGNGGGVVLRLYQNDCVMIEANLITGNFALRGGGLSLSGEDPWDDSRVTVANNIIAHNQASERGGGIHAEAYIFLLMAHNTIVSNSAGALGGGVSLRGPRSDVVNNIVWGNRPDQMTTFLEDHICYNLVQGGYPGSGNFSENPQFVEGDTRYHLSPSSPCIATGLDSLIVFNQVIDLPQRDFDGSHRPNDRSNRPDVGALESSFSPGPSAERVWGYQKDLEARSASLTITLRQTGYRIDTLPDSMIIERGVITPTIRCKGKDGVKNGIGETPHVILPPGENLLEIEIILDDVPPPYPLKGYQLSRMLMTNFFLKGADQRMNQTTASRYDRYVNLKPGSYELVFNPTDGNQYFDSRNEFSIPVTVLPPWWQRPWAVGLYAVTVLAIATVVLRVRLGRLRLQLKLSRAEYEAQQLAEIDRMKSRFFANLSHEFRTPLTLILGPADQLEISEREVSRREQLSLIQRNAQRLLRMVDSLLQFARIESGTIKLRVSLQSVPELLRRIVSSFSTAATKKGISLRVEVEPPSFQGYVDREKIEHIVENLLSNSLKYTDAGGTIELLARRDGTDLIIVVRDTGRGISPENTPHVFERFYRADGSHEIEGTGIGLSLTKELTELHNGKIWLESTHGVGTTVTVRIPLSGYREEDIQHDVPNEGAGRRAEETECAVPARTPNGEHAERPIVLVVEDNEDARRYIRSRLETEYEIVEAATGRQALSLAQDRIPELVVSDVMMPEMNGYELCRRLKADERTSHIPIILLTALGDRSDKIEGLQTGADDYLVKPFDAKELLTRVTNLIQMRERLREKFGQGVVLKPGEIVVASMDDAFLKKVLLIVEKHLADEGFNVEDLAAEVAMSRSQLHRKLKALTNRTPHDLIWYMRLHRAMDLLQQNAGTVSEVAFSVGFASVAHFTKRFHDQFGIVPTDARKSKGE